MDVTGLEVGRQLFGDDAGVVGVLAGVAAGNVGQFGLAAGRRCARYGNVGLLQGDLGRPLGGADGRLDPLAELGRSDQEQVLLLLRRDQHVVLVFALLFGAVLTHKLTINNYSCDLKKKKKKKNFFFNFFYFITIFIIIFYLFNLNDYLFN